MSKYMQVFKTGWNEMLIYRFDVISGVILSITRLLLAFLLWKAIFDVKSEVAGYSFSMMMTYYLLITFLSRLDKSEEVASQFAEEIRNGGFTKYITRPINILFYFISVTFSKSVYIFGLNLLGNVVWILIFREYIVLPTDFSTCIWAVIIFIIGLFFLALFNFFLTMLSFWFLDVSSFFLFKSNLIELLTGTLIPLSLLPHGVVNIFKFLPFYYVFYYPVSLCLNQRKDEIFISLAILGIWVVIFSALNVAICGKAKKSYDGVGI